MLIQAAHSFDRIALRATYGPTEKPPTPGFAGPGGYPIDGSIQRESVVDYLAAMLSFLSDHPPPGEPEREEEWEGRERE